MYLPMEMGCIVEASGLAGDVDAFHASVQQRIATFPDGRTIIPFWNWFQARVERPEATRVLIHFFMTTRAFTDDAIPSMRRLAEEHPRLTIFFYGDYYEHGWGQRALLLGGRLLVWDRFEVEDDMLPEARGIRNVKRLHGDGNGIPLAYAEHFDLDGDLIPDWGAIRPQVEAAAASGAEAAPPSSWVHRSGNAGDPSEGVERD